METKRVLIVMGSRSDLPSMEGCMKQLDDFQVGYEVRVLSAHRTPEAVLELSKTACERGIQVIIAAAGGAAHLAGVLASSTPLPVIGIQQYKCLKEFLLRLSQLVNRGQEMQLS